MKNSTKIIGIIATVAVIGLSFASCNGSKKEAASMSVSEAAAGVGEALSDVANTVKAAAGGGSGGDAETAGRRGEPTVPPDSDFYYELTDDANGVVIFGYKGQGGDIILPTEIEGMPVTEIFFTQDDFEMREDGFSNFRNARSVVIPDSYLPMWETPSKRSYAIQPLKWFGAGWGESPLEAVTFPKGITKIPHGMFQNCNALKTITIPDTVKVIELFAFNSTGLTSIVIPEGVKTIGAYAFAECENLTSITLPESIENIEENAFSGCVNLVTVNMPAHKIHYGAVNYPPVGGHFSGCSKLNLAAQKAIRDTGYTGGF